MRERDLAKFIRIGGLLGRPITEGRPEAVDGRALAAHPAHKLQHRHVRERLPGAGPDEDEVALMRQRQKNLMRAIGEGDAMLLAQISSSRPDRPQLRLQVELGPFGADDFSRAHGGQDRQFERAGRNACLLAKLRHEGPASPRRGLRRGA